LEEEGKKLFFLPHFNATSTDVAKIGRAHVLATWFGRWFKTNATSALTALLLK
jgi:hypothetical protein